MRNVKEFTILTKKNQLAFLPGEILKGELYLCFEKAIPIKSLKIILCGDGEGQWLIQTARSQAKQDGKKKILIDVGLLVFGAADNEKSEIHDRGRFVYDFEFNIPHNLPVSFKSPPDKNLGYARYFLKAILCRPKKRDKIKKFNIVINELIDPERPELAFQPGSFKEKNVRAGLVPCGSLALESFLNQSQYVQGQSIFINSTAHNKSSKIMKEVYAKLIRRTCCKSLCGASTFMIDTTSLHESRLGPNDKLVWTNKELKIPAVGPTITRNDDIRVDYIVRIGMYEEMGSEIHLDLPVIIGTMQKKGEIDINEEPKDIYDRKKKQYRLQLVKTGERDMFRQNLHEKVVKKPGVVPSNEKSIRPLADEINTAVDDEKMFLSFDGEDELYADDRQIPKNEGDANNYQIPKIGKNNSKRYENKSQFDDGKHKNDGRRSRVDDRNDGRSSRDNDKSDSRSSRVDDKNDGRSSQADDRNGGRSSRDNDKSDIRSSRVDDKNDGRSSQADGRNDGRSSRDNNKNDGRNSRNKSDNEISKHYDSEVELERCPSQNGKVHNLPGTIFSKYLTNKDRDPNLGTLRFNDEVIKDEKKEDKNNNISSTQKPMFNDSQYCGDNNISTTKKPILFNDSQYCKDNDISTTQKPILLNDSQYCGDNVPDKQYEKKRLIGKNKVDKKVHEEDECKEKTDLVLLRKSSLPSNSLSKKGVNASTGSLNISSTSSLNKNLGFANKNFESSSSSKSSLKKQASFYSDPSLKTLKGASERKSLISPFKKSSGSLNKSADSLINKDSNLPVKSNLKKSSSNNLNNSTGSIFNRELGIPPSLNKSKSFSNGSAEREPIFLKSSLPDNTESSEFLGKKKELILYKQEEGILKDEKDKNFSSKDLHEKDKNSSSKDLHEKDKNSTSKDLHEKDKNSSSKDLHEKDKNSSTKDLHEKDKNSSSKDLHEKDKNSTSKNKSSDQFNLTKKKTDENLKSPSYKRQVINRNKNIDQNDQIDQNELLYSFKKENSKETLIKKELKASIHPDTPGNNETHNQEGYYWKEVIDSEGEMFATPPQERKQKKDKKNNKTSSVSDEIKDVEKKYENNNFFRRENEVKNKNENKSYKLPNEQEIDQPRKCKDDLEKVNGIQNNLNEKHLESYKEIEKNKSEENNKLSSKNLLLHGKETANKNSGEDNLSSINLLSDGKGGKEVNKSKTENEDIISKYSNTENFDVIENKEKENNKKNIASLNSNLDNLGKTGKGSNPFGFIEKIFRKQKPEEHQTIKSKPGEDSFRILNEDKREIKPGEDKHKSSGGENKQKTSNEDKQKTSNEDKQKSSNKDKQEIKTKSETFKPKTSIEEYQEIKWKPLDKNKSLDKENQNLKQTPVNNKHKILFEENHDNKPAEDKLKVFNLLGEENQQIKNKYKAFAEENENEKPVEDKLETSGKDNQGVKRKPVEDKLEILDRVNQLVKQKPLEEKPKMSGRDNQGIKQKPVEDKLEISGRDNQNQQQKPVEDKLKISNEDVKRSQEYKQKTLCKDKKGDKKIKLELGIPGENKEEIKLSEIESQSEIKYEEILLEKDEKQGENIIDLKSYSNKDDYKKAVIENTEPSKKALIVKQDFLETKDDKTQDLTELESIKSCKLVKQTDTPTETNILSKNEKILSKANLYKPKNIPIKEVTSPVKEINKLKQENYPFSSSKGFENENTGENNSSQVENFLKKGSNNNESSKNNDNKQNNLKKEIYPPSPLKSLQKSCSTFTSKVNAPEKKKDIRYNKQVENEFTHETIEYYCDDPKCWTDEWQERQPIYQNSVRENRFNSNTNFAKEPVKSRVQKEKNNNSFEYAKKKQPKTQIAFGRTIKLIEQKNKTNPNEVKAKKEFSPQQKIKSYGLLRTTSDGKNNEKYHFLNDEIEPKTLLDEKKQPTSSFIVNSTKSPSKINISKTRNKIIPENIVNDKTVNSERKIFNNIALEKCCTNSAYTSDMFDFHKSYDRKKKGDQPVRISSCSPDIEIFSNNLLIEENEFPINNNLNKTNSSLNARPMAYRVVRTSNGNISTNKKPDARVVTNKVRSFSKGGGKKDEHYKGADKKDNKQTLEYKNVFNKQKRDVIKRDTIITNQDPITNTILDQQKIKAHDKQSESMEKEKIPISVADRANPIDLYFDSLERKGKMTQESIGDLRNQAYIGNLKGTETTTVLKDRQKINRTNEQRISLSNSDSQISLKNRLINRRKHEDINSDLKTEIKHGRSNGNINSDLKTEIKHGRSNGNINDDVETEMKYGACNQGLNKNMITETDETYNEDITEGIKIEMIHEQYNRNGKTKYSDNGQKSFFQKLSCKENSQFNIDWSRVPKFIDSKRDWHKPNCRWSEQKRHLECSSPSEDNVRLNDILIPFKTQSKETSSLNNANQQVGDSLKKKSGENGKQPPRSGKEVLKKKKSENHLSESEEYSLSRKLPKLPNKHTRSKSYEPSPKSEILSELLKNREALSPIYRTNLGPIHSYVGHIERLDNSLNISKDSSLKFDEENIKKEQNNLGFPYNPTLTELKLNSLEKELQLPSVPLRVYSPILNKEKNNKSSTISEMGEIETEIAKKPHSYAWVVDVKNKVVNKQETDSNFNELIYNKAMSSEDKELCTILDPDQLIRSKYDYNDSNKNIQSNDFRKKGKLLVPKRYFSSNSFSSEHPKKGLSRSMSMKIKTDKKIVMRSRSVEPHSSTKLNLTKNMEKTLYYANSETEESDINAKTSFPNKVEAYDTKESNQTFKRTNKKPYSKFKIISKRPKYDSDLPLERSKQQKDFTYTQIYAKKKLIQVESPRKVLKTEHPRFKEGPILRTKTHRIRTISEPLPEKKEVLPCSSKIAWDDKAQGRIVSYQYTPIEELTQGSEDSQDENEWSQKINDYIKKIKEKSNIYREENTTNCGYYSLASLNLPGETSYGKNSFTNKHDSAKEVLTICSLKSDTSTKIPPKSAVRPLVNTNNSANSYILKNTSCVEAVAVKSNIGLKSQINYTTLKSNKRIRLEDSFDQHEKSLGIVDESGNVRSNKQLMAANENEWILEENRRLKKIQQRKHDRFIKDLKSFKTDRPASCPSALGPREAIFDYHSKNMYQDVTGSETETEYTTDDEDTNDDFTNAFCSLEDCRSLPKASIQISSLTETLSSTDANTVSNIEECKLLNNNQNNGAENEEVEGKHSILKEKSE